MKIGYVKTESTAILWDLGAMERDIEARRFLAEVRRMPVVNLVGTYRFREELVEDADISVFPIVVSFTPEKYCVLSGGEQIEKARALGFWDIDCYFIKPGQQKKYIIDYDEETYLRAVEEYWADEV